MMNLFSSSIKADTFFREYWKKKPLCIRQALKNFISPISENELAGLACEEIVESRIVLEHGAVPWELKHGPFKGKDFKKLPETNWSLLVQAVNHWVPEVSDLLNHFTFLPSYYLDDVMVSYAPDQGGVGPHFDYYDVFILQGTGKRHWRLGDFCSPQTPTVEGSQLSILSTFSVSEEYILEPGDILYIPQQQAHWCVAQEAGLSYSIGFRTPAYGELLSGFCNEILSNLDESQRLLINPESSAFNPAYLTEDNFLQVQNILKRLLDHPKELREWLGQHLTEPKYLDLENEIVHKKYKNIDQLLSKYAVMRQSENCRFAYDQENLFIDGKCFPYQKNGAELVSLLCNHREIPCDKISSYLQSAEKKEFLLSLINAGMFYFE